MYVTDSNQALIWRVPPGGGEARVWFTDPGLETAFGPNGIQFLADGRTLLFALTTQSGPTANPQRPAGLYRLPVEAGGGPGQFEQFWQSGVADVPDGFAISLAGNVYVALAGTGDGVAVISPQGQETARVPGSELANQQLEVPFDQPASAAFLGESVLVTNHALFSRDPNHYAVLDVFAAEPGLPLFRPQLPANGDAIRASVRPRRGRGQADVLSLSSRVRYRHSGRAGADQVRRKARADRRAWPGRGVQAPRCCRQANGTREQAGLRHGAADDPRTSEVA